ncbi:hypothetical protein AGMMS50222_10880 [Endomicrobiia bacterium]|nr:hypothetical protein AGMMS49531_01330 [Endomicrobiia bacterium]GHT77404.1 hypothetical protein AGMMS50222_10880 [Endomicrobiia bacterium]
MFEKAGALAKGDAVGRNGYDEVYKTLVIVFFVDFNETSYEITPCEIIGVEVFEDVDDFIADGDIPGVSVNRDEAIPGAVVGVIKFGDEGLEFLNL